MPTSFFTIRLPGLCRLATGLALALPLAACGYKGDLTLPPPPPPQDALVTPPGNSGTPTINQSTPATPLRVD